MPEENTPSKQIDEHNLLIRATTLDDLERIYTIEAMSFTDAYPKSLLWQLLQDKTAICLIAEVSHKIVGFGIGIMRSSTRGHIISIAIDPEYRNLTFGSQLVSQLISALKGNGALLLELEVRISNVIAQKLYKKFNFQIKEIKQRYYSNGEDAYLMVCHLDN
ncbi:MAG: ribosomal protein S18-alanine N-acetyltransferase [Candidatus Helarchaeota archaeon]|nr:ribosomal protein S18-alanine N-acetyltransferase [Candidatus Helarchaeota archaeon]